jgi:DNA-binding transcriptional MerR regulator
MYIGRAARLSNVSEKTIRHYESIGLLNSIERKGAYRVFTESDVRFIRLIKEAQSLGFKLSELSVAMGENHEVPPWEKISQLIQAKEESLEQEIKRLTEKREKLRQHRLGIEACLLANPSCDDPLF